MLKEQNRLTGRQVKFIVSVRDEAAALATLMKRQGLTPVLVKRWFRRRFFRRALGGATAEKNKVLMGAELLLLRAAAWQLLGQMVERRIPANERRIKLCAAVITLFDVEVRRAKSLSVGRWGRARREKEYDEPGSLVHPNAAAEADRLLAEMEATAAEAILKARARRAGEDAKPGAAGEAG